MVMLPRNNYRNSTGLTLIEVLIALAITSIAITAIIKTVSENIRSTTYLEDKTLAIWAAQNRLNEARVGLAGDSHITLLGKEWYCLLAKEATPNPHIMRYVVNVFAGSSIDETDKTPLVTLRGYGYRG